MPGEFYIKGKKEKTDLSPVLAGSLNLRLPATPSKLGLTTWPEKRRKTGLNGGGLASGRVRHYFIGSG